MPHLVRFAALALALSIWSHTTVSLAAPELVWTAPEECPSATDVLRSFSRMSGEKTGANVRAVATVRRTETAFALELALNARSGTAELRLVSERCTTLAEVVALELALAADAAAVTSAAAPPEESSRLGVAASVGAVIGPLPGVAPAVRASVLLELTPLRLELGARHLFQKNTTYATVPERLGADIDLTAAFARVCSSLPRTGFGFSTCAGAELGAARGVGFGATQTFTSTQVWGALTVAPVLRFALASGLSFFAECELGLALNQPEFHARGLPGLFESDRTAAGLWLGVGDAFFE